MYNMSTRSNTSLTPMYGLGSYGRQFGAISISSPRTKLGSAKRIYAYLSATQSASYALNYMTNAVFGPVRILNGRLVYI